MLARKLLKKHMSNNERIDKIVKSLTRELLSHDYVITRAEAQDIGLPVEEPSRELADLMWKMYQGIAEEMKLAQPWNLEVELGGRQLSKIASCRALIESKDFKHGFVTVQELKRTTLTKEGMKFEAVQGKIVDEGWRQL